ncbi:acylphosphatase [Halomonas sp. DP8Y7-1]|uniref:acylphosphatase n=1 Tax=Halomonas sp. DP8Y7-1 TaxID=2859078 RepID=UPI0028F74252|nr:acylphosphatase [Halomonas sp. DP8Y7-1]
MDQQSVKAQWSAEEQREFEQEAQQRQQEVDTLERVDGMSEDEVSGTGHAATAKQHDQAREDNMESDMMCLEAVVEGQVQGVSFRWSTQQQAQAHGLVGHAHNQPDGSVEVLLCGPRHEVEQVAEWLEQGPPQATVTRVTRQEVRLSSMPEAFTTG